MRTGDQFVWLLERARIETPFQFANFRAIPGSPSAEETDYQFGLMLRADIIEQFENGFRVTEGGQEVLAAIHVRQGRGPAGDHWIG